MLCWDKQLGSPRFARGTYRGLQGLHNPTWGTLSVPPCPDPYETRV